MHKQRKNTNDKMGLGCGMNCLKILLFAFNFIFWLLGVALLAVGIWSRVDTGTWDTLLEDSTILNAANMMIAAGVIVAVIGFLGCCGAMKKSKCMLVSYAVLIFLIFILEIAAGIFTYTKKDAVQQKLSTHLEKAVNNSYGGATESDKALTKSVDWFQQNVKCCGTNAPGDWKKTAWYNKSDKSKNVPQSCCIEEKSGCNSGTVVSLLSAKKIYSSGCVAAGKQFAKDHMWKIGGAAIGIGVIQLFGIVFAICLCKAIGDEETTA